LSESARNWLLNRWKDLEFFTVVGLQYESRMDRERIAGEVVSADDSDLRYAIRFKQAGYHELNVDRGLTLDFQPYQQGQLTGTLNLGQLICGMRVFDGETQEYQLTKWFICDEAFRSLVWIVRKGTRFSEPELAEELLTTDYPDVYWAIVRLVLFDNVEAFVDNHSGRPARHPLAGRRFGTDRIPSWHGMQLPKDAATFVHELSVSLNQPQWWREFFRLARVKHARFDHPSSLGCLGCNPPIQL